jgi:hypothetical protein
MDENIYRRRAGRRNLIIGIVIGLLIITALTANLVRNAYFDTCTLSFDRNPESVIRAYVEAIERSDHQVVQRCWNRDAYFDLEAGCSEICLERILGTSYLIDEISLDKPSTTPEGRSNISAVVKLSCNNSAESHVGMILLDSVSRNVPWKHWKIISSDIGGLIADPWCQE